MGCPRGFVLLLFGLANAGVPFEEIGPGTYYVMAGLLIGKPLGILLFAGGARAIGAPLPGGLDLRDPPIVGVAASIGFTMSLFFATAAFPPGAALAETKMGALLSFVAPLALPDLSAVARTGASALMSRAAFAGHRQFCVPRSNMPHPTPPAPTPLPGPGPTNPNPQPGPTKPMPPPGPTNPFPPRG